MSAVVHHRSEPEDVPEKTQEFADVAARCTATLKVATRRSLNGLPFTDVTIVLDRQAPDGLLRNVRQNEDRTVLEITTTSRPQEVSITIRIWDGDEPAYPCKAITGP